MNTEKINCPKCKGEGYLYNNPTGRPGYKCPTCNTTGKIIAFKNNNVYYDKNMMPVHIEKRKD